MPTFLSFQRILCATVWRYLNFRDRNDLLRAFTASERKPRNQQKNLVSEFVQLLQKIPTPAFSTLQKRAYASSTLLGPRLWNRLLPGTSRSAWGWSFMLHHFWVAVNPCHHRDLLQGTTMKPWLPVSVVWMVSHGFRLLTRLLSFWEAGIFLSVDYSCECQSKDLSNYADVYGVNV